MSKTEKEHEPEEVLALIILAILAIGFLVVRAHV